MVAIAVSFRIRGRDLDPLAVSGVLGLEPDAGHRRGDPNVGRDGRRYSDFSEGQWCLRSRALPEAPLDDHIGDLISRLSESASALQQLRRQGHSLDVFVGVFDIEGNAGLWLSAARLAELAALEIRLELDLYS